MIKTICFRQSCCFLKATVQIWRRWRWGWMALLTTCLVVFGQSGLAPVVAQSLETAMIQVDGIPLFPVSSSEKLPAKQRAENVNQILQGLVNSPANATVTIDNSQALPILKVDVDNRQADLDLLTVNSKDAQGNSLQAMAVTWQAKLQTAINRGQQERANVWWLGLQSLACLGFAYLFHWLCGWFWRKRLLRLLPQATVDPITGRQPQSLQFLFKVILYLLQVLLWVGAISYIGGLLPWTRIWKNQLINTLTQTFTTPFIPAGGKSYSVLGIAVLLVSLAVIMNLAKTAQHLLRTRVLSATGLNRGAQEAVAFVANYALLFIGTLVLLQLWGFDLTSLTVFASVLGVGIGLGLQGFAKNFISGMVLIFEQPIKVGDFVKVGDYQGTVERINIRSTEIRTLDQVSIIVPNSEFLESEVVNWDHGTSISRLQIPVGIAYGSKPEAVRDALMEVASNYTGVLKNPSPRVFFTEFGESALEFILLVWINEPDKQFVIKSDLNFRIETILRDRNIEIPFPQRDLHIRSGKLPLDLPPELTASLTQLSQSLKAWLEQHPAAPGLSPQLSPTANLPPSNEGQEEQQP